MKELSVGIISDNRFSVCWQRPNDINNLMDLKSFLLCFPIIHKIVATIRVRIYTKYLSTQKRALTSFWEESFYVMYSRLKDDALP